VLAVSLAYPSGEEGVFYSPWGKSSLGNLSINQLLGRVLSCNALSCAGRERGMSKLI